MKSSSCLTVACVLFLWTAPARAGEFFEVGGVAIRGYDPVAYVTERQPVKGSAAHTVTYKDSLFYFSSEANREAFSRDPERYVPRYGGFCAYGTAKGYKALTAPEAFTIYQGKLYLNYNLSVREQWAEDIPDNIQKADHNWPQVSQQSRVIP